ncbi:MAG: thermonuclease family protein [Proteobacteria bacterium]|nr:thermonuclease family protein [Pseudomonadota bacterium]MBU1640104.1 thermonuclease family protein [Pseudomonadota bacterium]
MRKIICTVLFAILSTTSAYAEQCKVAHVSDGDTVKAICNGREVKIRLYGVDTPEKKQSFGEQATQYTQQAVLNKIVDVQVLDTDRYGRSVAVVKEGSFNLNEMLVKNGFAWVYGKYCKESFCNEFKNYEKQAQQQRIGLWSENRPTAPWDYRRVLGSDNPANLTQGASAASAGVYHGNVNSHVFHGSGCKDYNCKNCRKSFSSKNEAQKAGYRPHNQCVN